MTQLTWFFGGGPLVSQRSPRHVLNVTSRAGVVVRIEQGFDRTVAQEVSGDGRSDTVRRHVSQHLVFQLRRIGAAFADEVAVQPLLGDALELAEQVQFRVLSRIAPLRHQQVGREFVAHHFRCGKTGSEIGCGNYRLMF
jgi:hypothetical protein